jgi:hypothetical protein
MTDPKVMVGHYLAGFTWGIDGDQVRWFASVTKGGQTVASRRGNLYDSRGPEKITEEVVRAAVLDSLNKYIEENPDDDDEVHTYEDK